MPPIGGQDGGGKWSLKPGNGRMRTPVSPICQRSTPWRSPNEPDGLDTAHHVKRRHGGAAPRCAGSVAVEFALVAPLLVLVAVGITDFGMLATASARLAGTTRIGAEYARLHPVDTAGIQSAMQSAMSFAPPLRFPVSFPQSCECDD